MLKKILRLMCLFFLCAAFLPAAFSEAPELLTPIGVRLDTEVIVRGTISEIDCYEGAVVSPVSELWFEVDGKILDVNVLIGDDVKAGDVLLTLDERDIVKQIEKLDEHIEYMQSSHALEERIERLNVQKIQTEYQQLSLEGADEKSLALKALDIEAKQREISQTKEQFEIELDALVSQRDALSAKTGRDKLIAPCDGRVVFINELSPGDEVKAYDTIVCVSDDSKKKISSKYVSEISYTGDCRIYALIGAKEYALIPIPADTQKNLSISLKGGEIRSEFEFEEADMDIEIGQYALVCLSSRRKEDVLIAPKNALLSDVAGKFVYKIEDGVRVRCQVKVGTTTKTSVEILEGLEEGDEVYVKD